MDVAHLVRAEVVTYRAGMRRFAALVLVTVVIAVPALAKRAPGDLCRPARYTLVGEPIIDGSPGGALVDVGNVVALEAICPAVPPRLRRANRNGVTRVKASWDACEGLDGRVRFKGKLVDGCSRLVGRVRARRFRRRIEASRSDCGPGVLDGMPPAVPYEPTRESLDVHPLPPWFANAKFGIMIHWGIFTIPAWAPLEIDPGEWLGGNLLEPPDFGREFFTKIPYVEWYPNSLLIEGSPVQAHHAAVWGDVTYDSFRPAFDAAAAGWSADAWADAFAAAGARYVVLVTKHHDGYALWPSEVAHPTRSGWHTERDYVGELTDAVRRRCMRMGLYYSGGLDWSVKPGPITDALSVLNVIPTDPVYVAYAGGQWRELIDRYEPAVLWNDIGYPTEAAALALHADYYNRIPDGVVNDRFSLLSGGTHHDYVTPEFTVLPDISEQKFETVRGMGRGFGYNQDETEADYDSATSLIHLLIDVVSKNGNLLLNVGPMADGTIPAPQMTRLQAIGTWLAVNGEAIFDTTPWIRAEGATTDGTPVRFTASADGGIVYAHVLGPLPAGSVALADFPESVGAVRLLGVSATLSVTRAGGALRVELPGGISEQPAAVLAIELTGQS